MTTPTITALVNPRAKTEEEQQMGSQRYLAQKIFSALTSPTQKRLQENLAYTFAPNQFLARIDTDNLGLAFPCNLAALGEQISEDGRPVINPSRAYEQVLQMMSIFQQHRLPGMDQNLTFYLFGLLKTSDSSHLIHGLDYKALEGKNPDELKAMLESQRSAFGLNENFIINRAKLLGPNQLFLEVNIKGRTVSMTIGYPTKHDHYDFQGKSITLSETYGNFFSPRGGDELELLLTDDQIRNAAVQAHAAGGKAMVDFYAWRAPEYVTEDNYRFFYHQFVDAAVPDEELIARANNRGVILHLSDGRKVLVEKRQDSQDQLVPDLGHKTSSDPLEREKYEYWKALYQRQLRKMVDLGVDSFRIDLAHEMNKGGDFNLLQDLIKDTVDYASQTGGKAYFLLETYAFHGFKPLFRSWNDQFDYPAVKSYYDDFLHNLRERNTAGMLGSLMWLLSPEGRASEAAFNSNYDEMSFKDVAATMGLDEKGMTRLLLLLASAGMNGIVQPEEMASLAGSLVPPPGGERGNDNGYISHKHPSQAEFQLLMKKSMAEILMTGEALQAFTQEGRTLESIEIAAQSMILRFEDGSETTANIPEMLGWIHKSLSVPKTQAQPTAEVSPAFQNTGNSLSQTVNSRIKHLRALEQTLAKQAGMSLAAWIDLGTGIRPEIASLLRNPQSAVKNSAFWDFVSTRAWERKQINDWDSWGKKRFLRANAMTLVQEFLVSQKMANGYELQKQALTKAAKSGEELMDAQALLNTVQTLRASLLEIAQTLDTRKIQPEAGDLATLAAEPLPDAIRDRLENASLLAVRQQIHNAAVKSSPVKLLLGILVTAGLVVLAIQLSPESVWRTLALAAAMKFGSVTAILLLPRIIYRIFLFQPLARERFLTNETIQTQLDDLLTEIERQPNLLPKNYSRPFLNVLGPQPGGWYRSVRFGHGRNGVIGLHARFQALPRAIQKAILIHEIYESHNQGHLRATWWEYLSYQRAKSNPALPEIALAKILLTDTALESGLFSKAYPAKYQGRSGVLILKKIADPKEGRAIDYFEQHRVEQDLRQKASGYEALAELRYHQNRIAPEIRALVKNDVDMVVGFLLEQVPGQRLADLAGSGRLTALQQASVFRQIREQLAILHAAGIIHGGVHRNNILVDFTPEGEPVARLVDFEFGGSPAEDLRALAYIEQLSQESLRPENISAYWQSQPTEGRPVNLHVSLVPHPDNRETFSSQGLVTTHSSIESSSNLEQILKQLGVPAGATVLNVGFGRNPLRSSNYHIINLDRPALEGLYAEETQQTGLFFKDFFDPDLLAALQNSGQLQHKPDVILFWNLYGYPWYRSGAQSADPRAEIYRQYLAQAKDLVDPSGKVLSVEFMPPERRAEEDPTHSLTAQSVGRIAYLMRESGWFEQPVVVEHTQAKLFGSVPVAVAASPRRTAAKSGPEISGQARTGKPDGVAKEAGPLIEMASSERANEPYVQSDSAFQQTLQRLQSVIISFVRPLQAVLQFLLRLALPATLAFLAPGGTIRLSAEESSQLQALATNNNQLDPKLAAAFAKRFGIQYDPATPTILPLSHWPKDQQNWRTRLRLFLNYGSTYIRTSEGKRFIYLRDSQIRLFLQRPEILRTRWQQLLWRENSRIMSQLVRNQSQASTRDHAEAILASSNLLILTDKASLGNGTRRLLDGLAWLPRLLLGTIHGRIQSAHPWAYLAWALQTGPSGLDSRKAWSQAYLRWSVDPKSENENQFALSLAEALNTGDISPKQFLALTALLPAASRAMGSYSMGGQIHPLRLSQYYFQAGNQPLLGAILDRIKQLPEITIDYNPFDINQRPVRRTALDSV